MRSIFAAVALLALLSLLGLAACPPRCKEGTMRCTQGVAELCRPNKTWTSVVDCNKLDPQRPWSCQCPEAKRCRCLKPVQQPGGVR
jgi:hypothetical protein